MQYFGVWLSYITRLSSKCNVKTDFGSPEENNVSNKSYTWVYLRIENFGLSVVVDHTETE